MTSNVVTGRLEHWSYDNLLHCIWGNLYDDIHKRWREGQYIHTSHITSGDRLHFRDNPPAEGDLIKTLNSTYLLGEKQNLE